MYNVPFKETCKISKVGRCNYVKDKSKNVCVGYHANITIKNPLKIVSYAANGFKMRSVCIILPPNSSS